MGSGRSPQQHCSLQRRPVVVELDLAKASYLHWTCFLCWRWWSSSRWCCYAEIIKSMWPLEVEYSAGSQPKSYAVFHTVVKIGRLLCCAKPPSLVPLPPWCFWSCSRSWPDLGRTRWTTCEDGPASSSLPSTPMCASWTR